MDWIYILLIATAVGVVGFLLGRKKEDKKEECSCEPKYVTEAAETKSTNLQKLIDHIDKMTEDRITNQVVEELLGVSDATATRYLDDLEADGKLRQINAGPDTYYQIVK